MSKNKLVSFLGTLTGVIIVIIIYVLGKHGYDTDTLFSKDGPLAGIAIIVVIVVTNIYIVIRQIMLGKQNKLKDDPTAMDGYATFKSYKSVWHFKGKNSSGEMVDKELFSITYVYNDESGKSHEITTSPTFEYSQVQHLESLGKFKIRFKGRSNVITEELPSDE